MSTYVVYLLVCCLSAPENLHFVIAGSLSVLLTIPFLVPGTRWECNTDLLALWVFEVQERHRPTQAGFPSQVLLVHHCLRYKTLETLLLTSHIKSAIKTPWFFFCIGVIQIPLFLTVFRAASFSLVPHQYPPSSFRRLQDFYPEFCC